MKLDPIMEELRRHRDEHAARFSYDVTAILEDMRRCSDEWEAERKTTTRQKAPTLPDAPDASLRAEDAA